MNDKMKQMNEKWTEMNNPFTKWQAIYDVYPMIRYEPNL